MTYPILIVTMALCPQLIHGFLVTPFQHRTATLSPQHILLQATPTKEDRPFTIPLDQVSMVDLPQVGGYVLTIRERAVN
jgi:hypothetical protein